VGFSGVKTLEGLVAIESARGNRRSVWVGIVAYTQNTGCDIPTEWMHAAWFMPGLLVIIDNIKKIISIYNIIL